MSLFGSATGLSLPLGLALDAAGGFTGVSSNTTGPVAQPQTLASPAGAAVPFMLTALDPDGASFQFCVTTGSANGSVRYDPDTGSGTYTPQEGFTGTDSFAFTAWDGAYTSLPATVTVHVGSP
jgi:hypothetical protein